jgi:hypothetical protein
MNGKVFRIVPLAGWNGCNVLIGSGTNGWTNDLLSPGNQGGTARWKSLLNSEDQNGKENTHPPITNGKWLSFRFMHVYHENIQRLAGAHLLRRLQTG